MYSSIQDRRRRRADRAWYVHAPVFPRSAWARPRCFTASSSFISRPPAPAHGRSTGTDALTAGEDLDGAIELRGAARRVAPIERDFDRRRDADPFETLAIHQHVLDREQEQAVVADQERGRRQHGPFGAMADELPQTVLLESVGEHFLAAARALVDQHGDGLTPFDIDEAGVPVAVLDLHRGGARVEQVEILRLRAAPSAAQVPHHRTRAAQRPFGDQILERGLNAVAGI